jgi:asparagine synthase (glutamine-hydrolysing)
VARHFDTEHREATINSTDMLQELPRIIRAMDQPTGDGINSYFISKFAKEETTVALSGTGGDELFAGYDWFNRIRKWDCLLNFMDKVPSPLSQVICRVMREFGYNFPERKSNNFTGSSFRSIYEKVRSLFDQAELARLLSPSFQNEDTENNNSYFHKDPIDFFADRADSYRDVISRICYMQLKMDMPNLLLRDIDAMSMAHSLEVRVPFLDHKFVEFSATIPPDLIMRNGKGKYILLKALAELLPDEILRRKKMGFIFPIDYWLKGPLKFIVDRFLSKESIQRRGIFNSEQVLSIKNNFYSGKIPYFKLWNLVVLELWHRCYIDNDSFSSIPNTIEDLEEI